MSYQTHADLGGQTSHGAVRPEPEGELWHARWEPRVLALTLAMGATGAWNIDQSRAARETLPNYGELDYYQIWLAGLQRLLADRGLVGADELAAGRALHPSLPLPRRLAAEQVTATLARGSPTERPTATPARFEVGHAVTAISQVPDHHSRLPAYARGKLGRIERVHGAHVFADTHAQGLGEQAQWLYGVVFEGRTLWGADTEPGLQVSIDIWESCLEAVVTEGSV